MRKGFGLLAGLLVMTALLAPASAIAAKSFADTIRLPNGWLPEGVRSGTAR